MLAIVCVSIGVVCAMVLVAGFYWIPPAGGGNWTMMDWALAGAVGRELVRYADDHEGRFPRNLSDLSIGDFSPESWRFRDPTTKQEIAWIYYGGYMQATALTDEERKETVILASPHMVCAHKRIVVYADGSSDFLEEDKFALQLSKRLKSQQ